MKPTRRFRLRALRRCRVLCCNIPINAKGNPARQAGIVENAMTEQRVVLPKEGNVGDPRETNPCREQADQRTAQSCHQDRFHASHHRILVCGIGMRQRQTLISGSTCGGERGRARTCNRQLRRLMLYPIELLAPRASPSIVAASQSQPEVDKSRTSSMAIPSQYYFL